MKVGEDVGASWHKVFWNSGCSTEKGVSAGNC